MSAVRVGNGSWSGIATPGLEEDYDVAFGTTSHAAPTAGGVAALILSANPALKGLQMRGILRDTAVKIDMANTQARGSCATGNRHHWRSGYRLASLPFAGCIAP
ncbi:S8 family serine peptidase [Actibacterium sp. 188UL27-1]|uniref:S8 family serine peptidase n=1 Tax=Actibacterium sp. 188UL27-1 TaxID=2786961 RepID=UPI00195B56DA|nr:S8 family serine peptidase [Actibacterium sp. 188UL27-1]MBM7070128.1 S8 family serine peptidase [Actibacterium sp. 188UL27-1]